jgi:hypothetical protein
MYYHDCRTDEYYNEKYLDKESKQELRGYDWCAEFVVDGFFDNLESYLDSDIIEKLLNKKIPKECRESYEFTSPCGGGYTVKRKTKRLKDWIRSKLLDYMESERNELIISILDNMDEEEYERIKKEVDAKERSKGEEKQ